MPHLHLQYSRLNRPLQQNVRKDVEIGDESHNRGGSKEKISLFDIFNTFFIADKHNRRNQKEVTYLIYLTVIYIRELLWVVFIQGWFIEHGIINWYFKGILCGYICNFLMNGNVKCVWIVYFIVKAGGREIFNRE